ncbi:MAG: hypothetical protein AB7I30_20630, partial [Isosphaeraceae bacterium]
MAWVLRQLATRFARLIAIGITGIAPGSVLADDDAKLSPPAARPVDFRAEVWPIHTDRCHRCPGAEARKGGLRLDRK